MLLRCIEGRVAAAEAALLATLGAIIAFSSKEASFGTQPLPDPGAFQ